MRYSYKTKGTCAREISFDIKGRTVSNIVYQGGCPGNLLAIPKLVDGWSADEIAEKCAGIPCGGRPTSCADQLAKAVMRAAAEQTEEEFEQSAG